MNLVALLSHEKHKHRVLKTLSEIYSSERICYVSTNKPRDSLLPAVEEWLDLQYLYLVDAVTRTVEDEPAPLTNGAYVSSPAALDEIFSHVDRLLSTRKFGAVVFDSLCTLTAYRDADEVRRFIHKLLARVSLAKCEGVFLCVEPTVESWFIEELHKVADKVIRLE